MHLFLLFRVFFMFFSVFIAIGNFPALTSLLSIDDLTGSTVIPLIAHEAGKKHRNTQKFTNTQIQKYKKKHKYTITQKHKYLTGSTVIPLIAQEAAKKQTFSQKTAKTLHTQYIPM